MVFARQPLPFATLLQRLEGTRGPFLTRLQTVLDAGLVAEEFIRYTETGGIGFTAASCGRTIVPIVVAIEHVREETTRDPTLPSVR